MMLPSKVFGSMFLSDLLFIAYLWRYRSPACGRSPYCRVLWQLFGPRGPVVCSRYGPCLRLWICLSHCRACTLDSIRLSPRRSGLHSPEDNLAATEQVVR